MALVVGIASYAYWPARPEAVGDARRVAGLLESGGFKTRLVINPDSQALKKAWNQFVQAANAKPQSACLVYFAGQAATLTDGAGIRSGWVIPTDAPQAQKAQAAFTEKAISVQQLISDGAALSVRHQFFLFDTTFDDDWLVAQKPSLRLLSRSSANAARQVIVAGSASDPAPTKSHFTDALVNALGGEADAIPDGIITANELAVYLINHVAKATGGRQHPRYALSGDAALARGDFSLDIATVKPRLGRLRVDTQPGGARIRILNIKPKFSQGMALEPGRYHVEVTATGHRLHKEWVALAAGEEKTVSVRLDPVRQQFDNFLGMRFRLIPAGSFEMGRRNAAVKAGPDETTRRVTLTRPFYMQVGEVTRSQYRRFVQASGHQSGTTASKGCWTSVDGRRWRKQADASWDTVGSGWSREVDADSLPVSCISWQDANAFARWLSRKEGRSYRLPTEAQWEYACRAGSQAAFAFGGCLSQAQANFIGGKSEMPNCPTDDAPPRRQPVATHSLARNAWGLYHMHGNLAEWCRDFYGPYPHSASRDPLGPSSGTERVIRGGHYLNHMQDCRSAKRSSFPPQYASSAVGFRLTAAAD